MIYRSKNITMKCSLNWSYINLLWRIELWLSKLQLSVFLKIVWVFWLECVVHALVNNSFWISLTVFGLFCYCHFVIKSRATCRPKSRCQSDLSTVSVFVNRSMHQNLMHSGCCGTAVPNGCLQAFSLFPSPVPRSTKGLFTGCSRVSKDLLIYKRQYQIVWKCTATLGIV